MLPRFRRPTTPGMMARFFGEVDGTKAVDGPGSGDEGKDRLDDDLPSDLDCNRVHAHNIYLISEDMQEYYSSV